KFEKLHADFEKKYKTADFTKDESALSKALTDYEALSGDPSGSRVYHYFYYLKDLNAEDKKAEAELNKISQRLTIASNKIIFFELALGKIPGDIQKTLLSSSNLSHFKYFLENIFKQAKYSLSEPEEKILSLKSLPGHGMWVSSNRKLLSKQTVVWKKKEIPLSQAVAMVSTLPIKERHALHNLIMENLKSVSDFSEAEINAVYTDKKINDDLRGLKNPYDATLLSHETEESMVNALTKAITDGYKISHKFYKLKAKILKLKKLSYVDRNVGIGKTDKQIPFEKGLDIVRKAFGSMDKDFSNILDTYLENGQIDVFPKKGKTGGAYCSSGTDLPTLVLLNHIPEMRSVTTLAHEMGHGIHAEYSKSQTPLYQGHSIAVAEVASTFFEQVVFDNIFSTLSPKEQIVALHDKINDEVQTIFRQIACFNFEKDLHKAVREKGSVSKEEIGVILNKHMKAYLGPIVDMKEIDGYFFVYWSHIRNFFYVYSYAYGSLVSKALYEKYKKNPEYLKEIKTFLLAGCSRSPQDIFADIGIDTSDPKFWQEGLASIEGDIKKLEALIK
ncbi:MAG: M3 family oligoendopeptidase, partial [Candidatus Paceibacterota bacterium]